MTRTHFLPFSVLLAIASPDVAQQAQTPPSFTISTLAGSGTEGYSGDSGQATSAALNNPYGVAVDMAGNVYIADTLNNRVRKVTPNGAITTVAGTGAVGFGGDGGPATSALLSRPLRLTIDQQGDILLADNNNNRIRKITPNGIITTIAGSGVGGYSGDGGPATAAAIYPVYALSDNAGNIFIVDQNNHAIRKVNSSGIITTIAGTGVAGFSGDGGPGTSAALNGPTTVALNAAGDLFIADQNNNRVRKLSNGIITTVAGDGMTGYSGDAGPATQANLQAPVGLVFDTAGNLYISLVARVRVLLTNGTINTVAGDGTTSFSGDDGPATSATLDDTRSLATFAGRVYIADTLNNRIRLLTPAPQAPAISSGGIVSASAFGGFTSVSPGSWIEIYGSSLATDTRSWAGADFNGIDAPITLDGTTVTIGGKPAFIDYISPGQVNALVASNTPTGPQQITVTTTSGTSAAFNITVNATEPGLLAPASFTINGTPYAAAFFSDGTSVLPTGAVAGVTSRPAKPGDTIILYGVGFGAVTPSIPAGQLVQQSNTLASSFQMLIGGMPATVAYAGLAPGFTGLYQFDITVPSVAVGAQPLTFTLGGNPGAQKLNIAVGN